MMSAGADVDSALTETESQGPVSVVLSGPPSSLVEQKGTMEQSGSSQSR
jgi:hypothetical protein